MNQLPPQEPEQPIIPPTPDEKVSHIGLIVALAIGLIALVVLAGILLFRSRAAFEPTGTTSPFFFGSTIITPTPTPTPLTTPFATPMITPTPTPTPLIPSPSGSPHTVTITTLGISQMFGGTTTNTITLSPGTNTTVYIQGSVSHTPNPPTCSAVNVSYGTTTVTPACNTNPGFQIPTSLNYNTICNGIAPGNQTSWTATINAADTDSAITTTATTTAIIQC